MKDKKLHRVTECPNCKQTDWKSVKEDFINNVSKDFDAGLFTKQEYEHSLKFYEECSYDELSYILQMLRQQMEAFPLNLIGQIVIRRKDQD